MKAKQRKGKRQKKVQNHLKPDEEKAVEWWKDEWHWSQMRMQLAFETALGLLCDGKSKYSSFFFCAEMSKWTIWMKICANEWSDEFQSWPTRTMALNIDEWIIWYLKMIKTRCKQMLECGQIEKEKKTRAIQSLACAENLAFHVFFFISLAHSRLSIPLWWFITSGSKFLFALLFGVFALFARLFGLHHGQNNALAWKSNCNCYHISCACKRQRRMQKEPTNRLEYLGHIVEYSDYGAPCEWCSFHPHSSNINKTLALLTASLEKFTGLHVPRQSGRGGEKNRWNEPWHQWAIA